MPKLIRLDAEGARLVDDRFTDVADDVPAPRGDIILSLTRYQAEGEALLAQGRDIGVRVTPDESIDDLAYDLPRLPLVVLVFAKFRDGRPYSSASLLRQRYGFTGEVRAVGDVLREQAVFMVRCGFDAFEPADGSTPEQWAQAAGRFRHVYQRAADDREPVFVERGDGAKPGGNHGLRRV
jgi:uncharacterized protein (DUF934 family)